MGFGTLYRFVKLINVHRIATLHAIRNVIDDSSAHVGAVVVGVTAQRHAVVVHRTVNKGVVFNRTGIQGVNGRVSRKQLRTVHCIGAVGCDMTCRDVRDQTLVI